MTSKKSKAIVIGSGIAGIASAIRLANKGFEVQVFEKNAYPGGKLSEFVIDGYRFDAGPSLFTMPQFVEELFEISGKRVSDYFEYVKHDTACHYFWQDGITLKASSDLEAFATNVEDTFAVNKRIIINKLKKADFINQQIGDLFLGQSLHKISNFLNLKTIKALFNISKFDVNTSLHQSNQKDLKHPKLVQLFDRFATYNGSNPYKTPGIMQIIPHYEHNVGTFFPTKGMYSITTSLKQLAEDLGVVFHFNTEVESVVLNDHQTEVIGVMVDNNLVKSDVLVSNMDVYYTFKKLLPQIKPPHKTLAQERSSSAVIFYWGIKQEFPQLDLHNIFFSNDYKAEFESIFNQKTLNDDPTIYVHVSNRVCPDDAPAGCESWFVMVNAPANQGQDWDLLIQKTRQQIIQRLSKALQVDLASLIAVEEILDPRSIQSKTMSYQGALYGTSSNSKFAAFLRHPNFSKSIKNLYFVGGSVHPGGGIPLCLMSAKIAINHVE